MSFERFPNPTGLGQEAKMPRLFSFKPALTFKGRAFHGVRGWAGKPTHPPLTDFPVVCYVLAATFDLISFVGHRGSGSSVRPFVRDFFMSGTYVIIAGAIVSLATATTGFWDWWKGIDREPTGPLGRAKHTQVWRTINTHMTIMLTVTAIAVADIIVRLAQMDTHHATLGVLVLSLAAGLLVVTGAAYGGSLVFDYRFNVESLGRSTVWDESEVDQMPADKRKPTPAAQEEQGPG
jgi:uncharacterized membrane protein